MEITARLTEEILARAKANDTSLRALADAAGIAYATLHRSLAGTRPLNTDELARIAKALSTSPTELLLAADKAA